MCNKNWGYVFKFDNFNNISSSYNTKVMENWRKCIIDQLQERNKNQTQCFQELILQNNKLFENANVLRSENLKLRIGALSAGSNSSIASDGKLSEKIQHLEQKLLMQQEELTELHRRKGENSQQIIDLNVLVQEKDKALLNRETSLNEQKAANNTLKAEIRMYETSKLELENLNQILRDEHQALQLAFSSLEDKLRKAQMENNQLVERLIKYKAKDADKMNEENDNFLNNVSKFPLIRGTFDLFRKRNAKMQKELEEACRDTRGISPEDLKEGAGPTYHSVLPTIAAIKFDAHDGEVNAVRWSPVDRILATGGADRKVKLWDISKGSEGRPGTSECRGVLVGSNAGVMSVDFDSTGTMIIGASNDYASRVWTLSDMRLRHTLTGHSGKVMAAKFLGEPSKVVTGSHDRTLKIWDLRSRACIETKFAGSSCNDLVTADGSGSTIISGHFDKRIRFWDTRSDSGPREFVLNGKVTSLDLTRDGKYLLSCVRDDTLKLMDLRVNQVILTYSCDGFKVGCDWSRATFSPDGQYIAVGSADGSVYIWGVNTAKVETILKEHTSAVTATAWHPYASFLVSVDKTKKAVIWSNV
ncbi:autophagy-related protein 16-1 isoform X3 [Onthophagus taurus]|uniref:autophagy-related protein 16-1 isoform X3 n=1 Tax=Onthophagus taurus TaxID=166361 RepID=UPI0039BE1242